MKNKCKNISSKEYIIYRFGRRKKRIKYIKKKIENIFYLSAFGNRFAWSLKYEPRG